ncbi:MAG TPA: hypothetical protein VFL93_04625 [Longimicrobiaceae bacterium]|nr:hypothetical protein [Longimicrobiaceae bacterium]
MSALRAFAAAAILTALAGCALPATRTGPEPVYTRVGPLDLSATLDASGGQIVAAVDAMNLDHDSVTVVYPALCGISLVVFRPAAPDRPVWDSARWIAPEPGDTTGCPRLSRRLVVPEQTLARLYMPVVAGVQVLGDSLPAGDYSAALRFHLLQPRDTTLLLPAGPLRLE